MAVGNEHHVEERFIRLKRDAVDWEGVTRHIGNTEPILLPYLRKHRIRKADVLRLVPEAVNGIHTRCTLRNGHLWLESVCVTGTEDAMLDMVLWHALFPGLRAPLVPWWISGRFTLSLHEPGTMITPSWPLEERLPEPKKTFRYVALHRGMVVADDELLREPRPWRERDPFEWPFLIRLVAAPLLALIAPVGVVAVMWQGHKEKDPVPWWFLLLTPVLVPMLLLKWLAPKPFDRYLEPYAERIGLRFRERRAVEKLVEEALERDVPQGLRNK